MKVKKKSKVTIWLRAFRIFTLTGSLIPTFIGGILAIHERSFNVLLFVLAIAALVALQIAANLLNDSDDYKNKVDTKESHNSSGVIVDELLPYKTVKNVSYVFFAGAVLLGIYPAISGGIVLWVIALLGIASAYFYTRKPFELKYRGLGLPLIFLMFGPLPVCGAYYLQTKGISMQAVIDSIMVGLLTTTILHANDIRDIPTDTKAGIKTCSNSIGAKKAKQLYIAMVVLAYAVDILAVILQILPLAGLLVVLTLPIAWKNIRTVLDKEEPEVIFLDRQSAMLQLLFGILLIVSIFLS